jgi:hypothetical protein
LTGRLAALAALLGTYDLNAGRGRDRAYGKIEPDLAHRAAHSQSDARDRVIEDGAPHKPDRGLRLRSIKEIAMAEITIKRIVLSLRFETDHFSFERPPRLQTRWAEPTKAFTPATTCMALIAAAA